MDGLYIRIDIELWRLRETVSLEYLMEQKVKYETNDSFLYQYMAPSIIFFIFITFQYLALPTSDASDIKLMSDLFTLKQPAHLILTFLPDRWRVVKGQRNRLRGRRKERFWLKGGSHSTSTICLRINWSELLPSDSLWHVERFTQWHLELSDQVLKMSDVWASYLIPQREGQWAVAVDDGAGVWEVWPQRET